MSSSGAASMTESAPAKYQLKSDLALYCLPSANRDDTRKLAWTNSVCLLFLIVAIVDMKQPVFLLRAPEPPPEPMPVIILPPVEHEPETQEQPPEEEQLEEPSDMTEMPVVAPVLVAAADSVNFSVPVEGYTAISADARYVPPPPPVIPKAPPPDNIPRPIFKAIRFGGKEFKKQPAPSYPDEFQRNRIGGTVEALITVNTNGVPTKVEVGRSSGTPALDRHVCDFIRREWRAEAGEVANYRIAITFAP